ncbi:hypothetical protein FHR81_003936 [Actinoalloteichus hoggarensis]|uniref:Uncharacterized protein n=1 Tax=Actinoalloteichus hoggarensis TaxID=1470176 RepID=A0A221VW35_9PSEU|nr:hypothetical protein [Actinoalloteichus hoggarensis]ASO17752.1 hypothetical protein AHOG_00395 [Actinoalloteichus hoggarensis]MBB5922879.1 hypothetical protein [Actinoalloteichus hoggarensis]
MKDIWADDEAMGAALRDSVDGPAPAPTVDVEHVMRLGRRRTALRRGLTTLGTAGAAVGIGLGTVLLGGLGGTALAPAGVDENDPARLPPRVQSPVERLPGWEPVDGCPLLDRYGHELPSDLGPLPEVDLPSTGVVEPVLQDALTEQRPAADQTITFTMSEQYSERSESPRLAVNLDLVDPEASGAIYLEALPHHGDPTEAADRAAAGRTTRASSCEVAQRMTLDDGSVVQIYGVMSGGFNAESPSQELDLFHPANYTVSLDADGHLSTDFEASDDDPGMGGLPEDAGTGVVPLTTEELAAVGLTLAAALG